MTLINSNLCGPCLARNVGAAVAHSRYLHFLDDDYLMPGGLEALFEVAQTSNAVWIYGAIHCVDNEGNLVAEFHPGIIGNVFGLPVAGESISLQPTLLRTQEFYAAGTFDPNLSYGEDRDLGRRITRLGDVAWTSAAVAQIRVGEVGSTSDWSRKAASDRVGRERVLSQPRAYARLRASAVSDYWRGRVSRVYFASTVWNLKRKNLFIAAGRATMGLAFAGWHTLTPDCWHGLRTKVR